MKMLLAVTLIALFLFSALLDKASRTLPLAELRRRARGGKDPDASKLYKVAAHGSSLRLVLWLVAILSVAGLTLWAANFAWWLAVLVLLLTWLIWFSGPLHYAGGWSWSLAAGLAPAVASLISLLQPIPSRVVEILRKLWPPHHHTGVYEKEDLLELLEHQGRQVDNRLSETELKIVRGALTFGNKTVGKVMTPKKKIKFVAANDPVGPLLMDELHASGFSRFPVVKDLSKTTEPEVVGTLYLKDLVDHAGKGRVRDVMRQPVYFINEAQDLRQALAAFLKTHHHLLVVVNNFEEVAGVISLEDVIEQVLGEKLADEFERYDDLIAVAGLEAQKEHTKESPR